MITRPEMQKGYNFIRLRFKNIFDDLQDKDVKTYQPCRSNPPFNASIDIRLNISPLVSAVKVPLFLVSAIDRTENVKQRS